MTPREVLRKAETLQTQQRPRHHRLSVFFLACLLALIWPLSVASTLASPPPSPFTFQSASRIAGSPMYSCSISAFDDSVYCAGQNYYANLGDGTITNRATPVRALLPPGSVAVSVSTCTDFACALLTSGDVICWGAFYVMEDGRRAESRFPTRVQFPDGAGAVSSLSVGEKHTCVVIQESGSVLCWGLNHLGQLGDAQANGEATTGFVLASALPPGSRAVQVAVGYWHTCVVFSNGELWCFGYNKNGQCGDGTTTDQISPVRAALPEGAFVVGVMAGAFYTCAVLSSGELYCFGSQLTSIADPNNPDSFPPTLIPLPSPPVSLSASTKHICALTRDDGVWCMGQNFYDSLGDGTNYVDSLSRFVRVSILPPGSVPVAVGTGSGYTCVFLHTGELLCWGSVSSIGKSGLDSSVSGARGSLISSFSYFVRDAFLPHLCPPYRTSMGSLATEQISIDFFRSLFWCRGPRLPRRLTGRPPLPNPLFRPCWLGVRTVRICFLPRT